MADVNSSSTDKDINNGFEMVTRLDIECHGIITMDSANKIRNLLEAIERLAKDDPVIVGLANNGKSLADDMSNDADVIRERAVEAGVIGCRVETAHV